MGDPFEFYRLAFRTIRIALMHEGIVLDPLLTRAGNGVGEELYPALADPDTQQFCTKIARFWEEHHLGRVEVERQDPLTLLVYDCFECADLPARRPACADSGILSALFSRHCNRSAAAIETRASMDLTTAGLR